MATRRTGLRKRAGLRRRTADGHATGSIVVYVHGIGPQGAKADLKLEWDLALFGRNLGDRSRMARWADILHPGGPATRGVGARSEARGIDPREALARAGVDPGDEDAQRLAAELLRQVGVDGLRQPGKKVLPLPAFMRKPVTRRFLEAFVGDTAAYFFRPDVRDRIRRRLRAELPSDTTPVTIVAHSQGTIVALEVLAAAKRPLEVTQLVTLGSPLGITEIQDLVDCPLAVPKAVQRWNNFADPLDPVALDKGLGDEFEPDGFVTDEIILNDKSRRIAGFDPHSAVGYLAHPKVRKVVHAAVRFDSMSRFVVARDVAVRMGAEARHPVLIEILEPGYPAIDESREAMREHEARVEHHATSLRDRIERAATQLRGIVSSVQQARIDPLQRFVAAHLTPSELRQVAAAHASLRVYAVWRSASKSKLLHRSVRTLKADAALVSFGASGEGITWAVLDTGIRQDHPHFQAYRNIESVWDCTKPGDPRRIENAVDRDGHGTHVAGIIAGRSPASEERLLQGVAPRARLVVYKVLDDAGNGEDAWIIKALDHIARRNENAAEIVIHGLNLSLGGPFDTTVYGCGFSPICAELRRLWRSGVLVCVASGNEGQTNVETPDGELELNTSMSIADPANLDDCIAVGSVNRRQAAPLRRLGVLVARPDRGRTPEARRRRAGRAHPLLQLALQGEGRAPLPRGERDEHGRPARLGPAGGVPVRAARVSRAARRGEAHPPRRLHRPRARSVPSGPRHAEPDADAAERMTKVAVFTGAGASKALGYPLTAELLPRVRAELDTGKLFDDIEDAPHGRAIEAEDRDTLRRYLMALLPGFATRRRKDRGSRSAWRGPTRARAGSQRVYFGGSIRADHKHSPRHIIDPARRCSAKRRSGRFSIISCASSAGAARPSAGTSPRSTSSSSSPRPSGDTSATPSCPEDGAGRQGEGPGGAAALSAATLVRPRRARVISSSCSESTRKRGRSPSRSQGATGGVPRCSSARRAGATRGSTSPSRRSSASRSSGWPSASSTTSAGTSGSSCPWCSRCSTSTSGTSIATCCTAAPGRSRCSSGGTRPSIT
jgi:hypothetical protein